MKRLILKTLVATKLVRSTRGAHGGYALARPAREVSFLDVIEAVEGPVVVNVCQDSHDACKLSRACTMYGVWKRGQERMLEVYRGTTLDTLAMSDLRAAPRGFDSVWGKAGHTLAWGGTLAHDEFIVYKAAQQTLRYLVLFDR